MEGRALLVERGLRSEGWKGPDGEVEVGSAAPGASVEISTYRGHAFAAKLERHDEAFATYKIGAARRQTFRVRDPEAGPDL